MAKDDLGRDRIGFLNRVLADPIYQSLACLAFALLGTLFVYGVLCPIFKGRYFEILLAHRQAFQHVNVFLFWYGIAAIVCAWLHGLIDKEREKPAQGIMDKLAVKWQSEIQDQMSVDSSRWGQVQRDQGKDIVEAMMNANVVDGNATSPRMKSRQNCLLLKRILCIGTYLSSTRAQNLAEMMDINRDLSALDNDTLEGQFTFTRYIVYLMPVIGFLGTVWGIGDALGRIGEALPKVQNMEGFVSGLSGATISLQVAFDTTFLALVLSGVLTFILMWGTSFSQNLLAKVDTWIIENILSHVTEHNVLEHVIRYNFNQMIGTKDKKPYEEGLGGIWAVIDELRRTTNSGFVTLAGKGTEKEAYKGGLAEAHITLEKLETIAHEIKRAIEKLADQTIKGSAFGGEESLNKIAQICEKIQTAQSDGIENVKQLTKVVEKVPKTVDTLNEATDKLLKLTGMLEDLGKLAENLSDSIGNLPGIYQALVTEDKDKNPTTTVHEIIGLRKTLTDVVAKASSDSARSLDNTLQKFNSTITVLESEILALNKNFISLQQTLLERLPGGKQ